MNKASGIIMAITALIKVLAEAGVSIAAALKKKKADSVKDRRSGDFE